MTSIVGATRENISPRCIVVGDPARAKAIAKCLDKCTRVWYEIYYIPLING